MQPSDYYPGLFFHVGNNEVENKINKWKMQRQSEGISGPWDTWLKNQADPADQYMALRLVSPAQFLVCQPWDGLHNAKPTGAWWDVPFSEGKKKLYAEINKSDL